jgi:predicted nucleotidyltransferase
MSPIVQNKRDDILRIATQYGASNVRVFGSVARGEAGPESDIDVLVHLEPGRSLLDIVAIKQELEELLGHKVDVLTEASISPYLRERILTDAIRL